MKLSCTSLLMLLTLAIPATAFPLQDAARRVTGSVVDQSGAAVPRVLIEVRTPSGQLSASTLTDTQGRFALELRDGNYVLDAMASGLAPIRQQPLEVGPSTAPITLTLAVPAIREQIVVTATRTEAPLAQVGSSTTVIQGDKLASEGVETVAEALSRVSGLTMVRDGADGQLASLFIRGGESDYTKVLIDGIPVNDPGGSFNFADLSITDIDRIEIVRGPQSALFGSDAMSGVIQVFTRHGTSEGLSPRPRIALEGGSFDTFRYEAGIEGKGERLDYAASFSRLDTDNNVFNGSFNDATASGNLGLRLSQRNQLRVVFRSDAGRTGVPGQWAFHSPEPDVYYRHRDLAGGITFTSLTTDYWTQSLSYTVNDTRQFSENDRFGSYVVQYQGRTAPDVYYDFPYQNLNQIRRQRLAYQSEWSLPRAHVLTAGAEYERETGTVGDPSFDLLAAKRVNFGGFIQDQWFLAGRFFGAAGVRFEDNQSFGFSATPRLSLAWHAFRPLPGARLGLTKIKANFGLGIKEPTLVESYSKSPYFLGNPTLKAERSTSYDAGIEQEFGDGKGSLEVTYFENHYRNQIDFVTTDLTTYAGSFFNIGKTRARGLETSWRQSLGPGVDVSGSYTFLDSLVLENIATSNPIFAPGQELFRRPRHSGYLNLTWKPGRWVFGATGTFVGRRTDSDLLGLDLRRNPGYGVLDLLASFRLLSGVRIFAVVHNTLDKNYMEALGYPALPARFRIGLSAGF